MWNYVKIFSWPCGPELACSKVQTIKNYWNPISIPAIGYKIHYLALKSWSLYKNKLMLTVWILKTNTVQSINYNNDMNYRYWYSYVCPNNSSQVVKRSTGVLFKIPWQLRLFILYCRGNFPSLSTTWNMAAASQ